MSWTCPYCGNNNENKPLNRRHTPTCNRCGKEYITAKDLEKKIENEIGENEKYLVPLLSELEVISDHLTSLQDEVASIKIEYDDKADEVKDIRDELARLRGIVIYRGGLEEHMELRNERVINDKKQKRLVV